MFVIVEYREVKAWRIRRFRDPVGESDGFKTVVLKVGSRYEKAREVSLISRVRPVCHRQSRMARVFTPMGVAVPRHSLLPVLDP